MMRKFSLGTVALVCLFALGGCEGAKQELGLTRSPPDEFAVVKRAPLEMPPEYTLRAPQPGAPRPQEQAVAEQARAALLGQEYTPQAAAGGSGLAAGEAALLNSANAGSMPNIRQVVDSEAATMRRENEPVVKKILNIGKDQEPAATIVDPEAEAARLQKNAAEGKPATEGETPVIQD